MSSFRLTSEHIKLMSGLYWTWESCEYGAPSVDCKRPFGNSGRHQIVMDMADVLEIPEDRIYDKGKDELIEPEAERLEALFRDMPKALGIVTRSGSFVPGLYECPPYTSRWVWTGP